MIVRAKFSALKQGHWYEYLVRFALGELATVVAGWWRISGDPPRADCF